jgi:hypothetical protein
LPLPLAASHSIMDGSRQEWDIRLDVAAQATPSTLK